MIPGFDALAALLRDRSGLALGPDKLYLVETRLTPILRREGLRDLPALVARLQRAGAAGEPALAREVIEAMTTGDTLFFRDEEPFAHFRRHALPRLHAARPPGQALRVWSAATATGQEAYSIAMTVDAARPALGGRAVEILGTDIARGPLARAREGFYAPSEVRRGLPVTLLFRCFAREEAGWRVADHLRAAVEFREWNLLSDPAPLGRFDAVFLRNVLLCFDTATKTRVLDAVAGTMPPDGFLYLGGTETVLGLSRRFAPVPTGGGVYAPCPAGRVTPPREAARSPGNGLGSGG